MNIFRELDAILAALKPSQYRALWQLYNWDESKRGKYSADKYKKIINKNTPGVKNNIFTENKYNEVVHMIRLQLDTFCLNELNLYGRIKQVLLDTEEWAKYISLSFGGLANSAVCKRWLAPIIKSEAFVNIKEYFNEIDKQLDAAKMNPNLKKVIRLYQAVNMFHTKESLDNLVEDWALVIEDELRKRMNHIMPLKIKNNKDYDYTIEDGVTYYLPKVKGIPERMIGDKLKWPLSTTLFDKKKNMVISPNPKIKHLYDTLFPTGKDRIIINIDAKPTIKDVAKKAETIKDLNMDSLMQGIYDIVGRYLIEKKHVEPENVYAYEDERDYNAYADFFIDGLYYYKVQDKVRGIRIGKMLNEYRDSSDLNKDEKHAIQFFNLVKIPSKVDDIVVLSRHPYDLAGMSTDRGWRSCMNLIDGDYNYYVPTSIIGGALIAYLCSKNDTNINNPKGRVLIKPHIKRGQKISANPINFKLFCSQTYGTFPLSYIKQVQDWINDNWNSRIDPISPSKADKSYQLSNMMYEDPADSGW